MARAFLDANILFSAALRDDAPMLRLWDHPAAVLLASPYVLEEARRNLFSTDQPARLAAIAARLTIVPDAQPDPLLIERWAVPAKDAPVVAAAVGARAQFLITGDRRDFGHLYRRTLDGVTILPPREFDSLLRSR